MITPLYFEGFNRNNIKNYNPEKACQEFEALFIYYLLKEARKTVSVDEGILPQTRAEEIFKEMFDEYLSLEISRSGGIGLRKIYEKYVKERG